MNPILLLPSARLLPLELQAEFGAIATAMVPLDSRPALHYIAEPYVSCGYKVVVAVHESADQVDQYIQRHPEIDARAVRVGATRSLGETVLTTIEAFQTSPDRLVINFADTFVGDSLLGANTICYQDLEDVYRWTTFRLDDSGSMSITEKNQPKFNQDLQHVFVGVFSIGDVAVFAVNLRKAIADQKDEVLDPFYLAIKSYFDNLRPDEKVFQRVADWRDFGHLDTYHATKKAFCLNHRWFNELVVDDRRGVVTKTSSDADKLKCEIEWYLKLPRRLQYLSPRVFDYSLDSSNAFVEMEYYGYPALSDVYLYGDCDLGAWNRVFDAIEWAVAELNSEKAAPRAPEQTIAAMRDMYETKTLRRLEGILHQSQFAAFREADIRINDKNCFGLERALSSLPDIIEDLRLYEHPQFTLIHGDLCLSNILFDRRNGIVRLIDPRGSFGETGIYGDPRYDWAKLCHSLSGDYDFFLNGLFDLKWSGTAIYFAAHLDQRHEAVKALFRQRLRNTKLDEAQLRLIEALLFLSLAPLHNDRPRSQMAFLARGLEIFTAVSRTAGSNRLRVV